MQTISTYTFNTLLLIENEIYSLQIIAFKNSEDKKNVSDRSGRNIFSIWTSILSPTGQINLKTYAHTQPACTATGIDICFTVVIAKSSF